MKKLTTWLSCIAVLLSVNAIFAQNTAKLSFMQVVITNLGVGVGMSPAFDSNVYSYELSTEAIYENVTVYASTTDAAVLSKEIRVNSGPYLPIEGPYRKDILINMGLNIIEVRVIALDGTTKVYTLNLTRNSSDASLGSIVSSQGNLNQPVSPGETNYTLSVGSEVESVKLTSLATHPDANLQMQIGLGTQYLPIDNGATTEDIPLVTGNNYVFIKVIAQDGWHTLTYTLNIFRPSAIATIALFEQYYIEPSLLTPQFSSGVTSYTVQASPWDTKILFYLRASDHNSSIDVSVNNSPAANISYMGYTPELPLIPGFNIIKIKVNAQDPAISKTYTITVIRPSTDASLSGLEVSEGTLSPVFDPAEHNYTVSVPNATEYFQVTPTSGFEYATMHIRINGSVYTPINDDTISSELPLTIGQNTIDIKVTAQDNVNIQTYTLTVFRPSNIATLESLTLSSGTLSPVFSSNIMSYNANAYSVSGITLLPTLSQANALIEIRVGDAEFTAVSSGYNTPYLPLELGNNTIEIRVVSQDGLVTNTYTLTVFRASADAALFSLLPSVGTLQPGFDPAVLSYAILLVNTDSAISFTPSLSNANADMEISINNSPYIALTNNVPSGNIPLNTGTNAIRIKVTAQDGITVKTYNINVKRPSNNADLSTLSSFDPVAPMFPTFSVSHTDYTATVGYFFSSAAFKAVTADANASVAYRINGSSYNQLQNDNNTNTISLQPGNTTLEFKVTAEDGLTVKIYKITITRTAEIILDKIGLTTATKASQAYSLRKLAGSYNGFAINVRRTTDNTLLDIGFDANGDLDTAALLAFAAGQTVTVTRWYDQSGAGLDIFQDDVNFQPKIVDAGTLQQRNGRPYLYFGNSNLATIPATIFANGASMMAVAKGNSLVPSALATKTGKDGIHSLNYPAPFDFSNTDNHLTVGNAVNLQYNSINLGSNNVSLLQETSLYGFTIPVSGTYRTYRNGIETGSNTVSGYQDGGSPFRMGNRNDLSSSGNIFTSEMVLFNKVLSTVERQAVEASQTAYYLDCMPWDGLSVVASQAAICPGGSVTLTADGGTNYQWSPATGLSATTGVSVTATPTQTTTYTVSTTNTFNCTYSKMVTVTVNTPQTITITPQVPVICPGGSILLAASGITDATWNPVTGLNTSIGTSVVASPVATTTYSVTGTDSNGCTTTQLITVTVGTPVLSTNVSNTEICLGGGIAVTASGMDSYTWSPSTGLNTTTGPTVIASPNMATTYTVTGTNALGCSISKTVSVTIANHQGPEINASSAVFCGVPIKLTIPQNGSDILHENFNSGASGWAIGANSSAAVTNWFYTESPYSQGPDVSIFTQNNDGFALANSDIGGASNLTDTQLVSPAFSTVGVSEAVLQFEHGHKHYNNDVVRVEISVDNGTNWTLLKSYTADVAQKTIETISLAGYLNKQNVKIRFNYKANWGYYWYIDNVKISQISANFDSITWQPHIGLYTDPAATIAYSGENTNIVYTKPATSTTYTATSGIAGRCDVLSSVPIVYSGNLTIHADSLTICESGSTTLTAIGNDSYQWSPSTGLNTTLGATVIASPSVTTTYTVTGLACQQSQSVTVSVQPTTPLTVQAANTTICIGESTTITASGMENYSWSPSTGLNAVNGAIVSASPSQTTTYTVTGSIASGCSLIKTITITVPDSLGPPVNATSVMYCGTPISLSLPLNSPDSEVKWLPLDGLFTDASATIPYLGQITAEVFAKPESDTIYTATTSVAGQCELFSTVTIATPFDLDVTADTTTLCSGQSAILTATGTAHYQWSPAEGLNSTTGGVVIASPLVTTTYTVTDTEISSCPVSKTITINVESPNIYFNQADPVICPGAWAMIAVSGMDNYSWSPSEGLDTTSGAIVTASPGQTTTYTVTGTNASECTATGTITVVVSQPEVVINASSLTYCNTPITLSIQEPSGITYENTYWWPFQGLYTNAAASIPYNGQNIQTVYSVPASEMTYTVFTSGNGLCNVSSSIQIGTTSNTLSVNASSATICRGNNTTITANGAVSYQWSPATGLNTTSGNTVIATPTATRTYTVTGTTAEGCIIKQNITITVVAKPQLLVNTLNNRICQGDGTVLTASGADTYSWFPATGLDTTMGAIVTASPEETTTYTITGQTLAGCVITETITVFVNPLFEVSPENAMVCSNGAAIALNASGNEYYTVLMREDFNNGISAWQVSNGPASPNQSQWSASGMPFLYYSTPYPTANGGNALIANSDAGGEASVTDTYITSGGFSTLGQDSAELTFQHLRLSYANDIAARVDISVDGGTTWSLLKNYLGIHIASLSSETISLTDYMNKPDVRIRFHYASPWGYFWMIDDVKITAKAVSPVVWSPAEGLYLDALATTAYNGESTTLVYAKPANSIEYTAKATLEVSCTSIAKAIVTGSASGIATVSSDQALCYGTIASDLVLSGNASVIKWQKATNPEFLGATNIATTSHTLSGNEIGYISTTTYLRAVLNQPCNPFSAYATLTVNQTTWNGTSWSNGEPDAFMSAIISGNYNAVQDLYACSLLVHNNAEVKVNTGYSFHIAGIVDVASGSLTFENNASLLQTSDVENSGNIILKRNTLLKRLDYSYWGSPVKAQNLKIFSPQTVSPPVGSSRFYVLDEPTNSFLAIDPVSTFFAPANGYMIRAPNNFTATPQNFTGTFKGVPQNGPIAIAVTSSANGSGSNLIANPYPSPVNGSLFLAQNPGILYFWTHINQLSGGVNYASYSQAGGTAAVAGSLKPNGMIQTGQGFIYQTAQSGNAIFNNTMRISDGNAPFFRSGITIEKHRFWLNLSNASGAMNQMLVAYMDGASNGIDLSTDAKLLEQGNTIASRIGNESYIIQGRALPFSDDDVIPLAFHALTDGDYTISLDDTDGLFAEGQDIFLKDNFNGAMQNIKLAPYAFYSMAGSYGNRFEIVYQNASLSIDPVPDLNSIVVFKENGTIRINSGKILMDAVNVFDIRGRLLLQKKNINASAISLDRLVAEHQVLFVQLTSTGNKTVTKKIAY